jgi:hypothetical protein
VRDLEIGQPINSENCSETAEGVARESEGRSRLSLQALYDKISRDRCGDARESLRQAAELRPRQRDE